MLEFILLGSLILEKRTCNLLDSPEIEAINFRGL